MLPVANFNSMGKNYLRTWPFLWLFFLQNFFFEQLRIKPLTFSRKDQENATSSPSIFFIYGALLLALEAVFCLHSSLHAGILDSLLFCHKKWKSNCSFSPSLLQGRSCAWLSHCTSCMTVKVNQLPMGSSPTPPFLPSTALAVAQGQCSVRCHGKKSNRKEGKTRLHCSQSRNGLWFPRSMHNDWVSMTEYGYRLHKYCPAIYFFHVWLLLGDLKRLNLDSTEKITEAPRG